MNKEEIEKTFEKGFICAGNYLLENLSKEQLIEMIKKSENDVFLKVKENKQLKEKINKIQEELNKYKSAYGNLKGTI